MPDFRPYLVIGFALGGVYAMSGVGLVVLYRTTGVLNLFYGAVGSIGTLTAWELINEYGWNEWMSYGAGILLAGTLTFLFGWILGPKLSDRNPLEKAAASLGFALVILGFMQWHWTPTARSLSIPSDRWRYTNGWFIINATQFAAMVIPLILVLITTVFLNRSKLGTAMRALADGRENTALLGVPVRRVEASAWFVSGVLFGLSGILLGRLVSMEIVALTFTIPIAALAAALIGRLESLWVTLAAAFVIGIIQAGLNAVRSLADYREATPFIAAILVLLYFGWRQDIEGRVA